MLLSSFSYSNKTEIDWNVFKDAEELGDRLDYTLEVINMVQRGDIKNTENFNLGGYIYKANNLKKCERQRELHKLLHIHDTTEDTADKLDISTESVSLQVSTVDEMERIIDDAEVNFCIRELKVLAPRLLIEYQIDIMVCIRQALLGYCEAMQSLQKITEDNIEFSEILQTILASGESFEYLLEKD